MTLKHLRSSTADKRPQASGMADGQLAINTASGSPGLFFKDTNGSIVKIGPVHVGSGAPNASPASGGTTGNSLGEQWLDTSNGNYVFKIWDGGAWRSETGEFVNASGDTMTGSLVLGSGASLVFEGSTDDGFETTLTVVDPTADRTITLPNVNGTVITTGDTGTVTSTMLLDGTIVNADVNASAAIAGTKISPDFGSQTVATTGVFSHALGSSSAPTVTFAGDTNTGIYSPGADQVAISTGGSGRLFVDASGRVGVGTASPGENLSIGGGANLYVTLTSTGGIKTALAAADANGFGWAGSTTNHAFALFTNNTERARIDSSGRLLVGSSTAVDDAFAGAGGVRVIQAMGTNSSIGVHRNDNSAFSSAFIFTKARGTAFQAVANNDVLGIVSFQGANGSAFNRAADIRCEIDGVVSGGGVGDMPGRLTFTTTSAGASTPTERLRITSAGLVGIGTTSPASPLEVVGLVRSSGASGNTGFGAFSGSAELSVGTNGTSSYIFSNSNIPLIFSTFGVERARIDSSGRFLIGTSTAVTSSTGVQGFLQHQSSDTGTAANANFGRWTNDTGGYALYFAKSRGTSVGTQGLVSDGDFLGALFFEGSDGTQLRRAASITANVDGTPGSSDMPGRLVFSTTADGASSPTERMRIDNKGGVGIGGTAGSSTTLRLVKNITGSTTAFALNADGQIQSDVTSDVSYFRTSANTADAAFSLASLIHYQAAQGTITGGTRTAPTNQYGFWVRSSLTGATNNYGFYSDIASGTGRWNFYANGTADSYFASNNFIWANGGTERARIDSSGRLLVGTSTARTNYFNSTGTAQLQIEGVGTAAATASITCDRSLTAAAAILALNKSAGDTVGSNTLVPSDDTLGVITFQGNDGTEFVQAASISAFTDGTPGANSMPGRIVLSTTASGASTPTERLRITSAGNVGIGTTSPGGALEVNSAAATAPAIFKINTAEAARIDSSGRLLVGTSSNTGGALLQVAQAGGNCGRFYGSSTATSGTYLVLGRSNGTLASPTVSVNNDVLGAVYFDGYNGSSFIGAASIKAEVDGVVSGGGANDMPGRLVFATTADGASSPTERMRIDSSGRLLVGTSTSTENVRVGQKFACVTTGGSDNGGISLTTYGGTNSNIAPVFDFQRSRGTTDGSLTEVISGDRLGYIVFRGADGATFSDGAVIIGEADGDWTTSGDTTDSPGRLVFSTTADGASSPTERMRIDSRGAVRTGNQILYTGTTGAVTATTGTTVFNFDFSGTTTRHTALVKLSVMHLVATNNIASQPAAEYIFAVEAYTTGVCAATSPTAIFQNVYVAATHFAFADVGSTSFKITLTNPSATAASAVYYKVEVLDNASALDLTSVTTT